MTPGSEHHTDVNDREFAAAWAAFARQDAMDSAPPELEARVREAARAEFERRHAMERRLRRRSLVIGMGMAAAVVIVAAAAGFLSWRSVVDRPAIDAHVASEIRIEPLHDPAPPIDPGAIPDQTSTRVEDVDVPTVPNVPDALLTLAVDPVQDTEQLALVHIRVPQDALRALGISTNEPVTSRLVDVEVLVGGDGLPRDIRTIRTVVTPDQHELSN